MYIDLKGNWDIELTAEDGVQKGGITLPGCLQAQGYGNPISRNTPWVSGLHDAFWYEQEPFKKGDGGIEEGECLVPFLCQPPRHFIGEAFYERRFSVENTCSQEWILRIELTKWRTRVWIDGELKGTDCSLCTAHEIFCGKLSSGVHTLRISVDNSMQYPYRPDGHGVSDALGATWNGMAGEIALMTEDELQKRDAERKAYAKAHPRRMEVREGNFYADGKPVYFRATHFGGDYPMTGYPETDRGWWKRVMDTVKAWGLNAIRCHSYCPPEAAFQAADEAGVFLLAECGMWNIFREDIPMLGILKNETERILRQFGHHPSFAFFSPSNEPGGKWYQPLRDWVEQTREYDRKLGYEGRRLYTAQSGWFYDVPPAEITGTDFIYFHRSKYGPVTGGSIRNSAGWKGRDHSPSLEGAKLPVVCHELGQWCVYPDFRIIPKSAPGQPKDVPPNPADAGKSLKNQLTGYLRPGNFRIFEKIAEENGLLPLAGDFLYCSGRNQLRLYKEELEANFRTPQLKGFELLDLHDYAGQGTALVGFLDVLWQEKGYAKPEEFRSFCGDTVILIRCSSYVWKNTDRVNIPVEISHFGQEDIQNQTLFWQLREEETETSPGRETETALGRKMEIASGQIENISVSRGTLAQVGSITLDFCGVKRSSQLTLTLCLGGGDSSHGQESPHGRECSHGQECSHEQNLTLVSDGAAAYQSENSWQFHVFVKPEEAELSGNVLYTREWVQAKEALTQGKRVVYSPYLSELSYECPALSMKNVFWNAQMGPSWIRSLGITAQEKHPLFAEFPSARDGGWQWEDILEHSRGFWMKGMKEVEPIVRSIDDWNRSLSLGLLFEAKAGNGRLFMVSADLEGSFEERPAAYCLKQVVLRYVASEEFQPKAECSFAAIEEKLFPVMRMERLTKEISYDGGNGGVNVKAAGAEADANPNLSVRIEGESLPGITVTLKKAVNAQGLIYVPDQKDRVHEGFIKDYRLEYYDEEAGNWYLLKTGTFLNTSLSQKADFQRNVRTDKFRLTVVSCYGCDEEKKDGRRKVWKSDREGWIQVDKPAGTVVQIAGLHIVCDEECEPSDEMFWAEGQRSTTKEIDN